MDFITDHSSFTSHLYTRKDHRKGYNPNGTFWLVKLSSLSQFISLDNTSTQDRVWFSFKIES